MSDSLSVLEYPKLSLFFPAISKCHKKVQVSPEYS